MKKWIVLGSIFAVTAVGMDFVSAYFKTRLDTRSAVMETRARLETEAKHASVERVESVLTKLGKLARLEELEEFALKDTVRLSKGERAAAGPMLRAKLFEAYFRRAELLLGRAGDLLRKDENHPTGKDYIERARKIYAKVDKIMDEGVPTRSNDPEENARLNYMKGVFYHRSLFFIKDAKAEASRVEELVGLAIKHYSAVYPYIVRSGKDGDQFWRTDVAIELLQKIAQQMGASGDGAPGKIRLELLPSSGANQGPTFSIEGSGEGRH